MAKDADSKIPTRWLVIDADWGEGKKQIYCSDGGNLSFHGKYEDAKKDAEGRVREGEKLVAIAEVKTLLVAKPVEYDALRA